MSDATINSPVPHTTHGPYLTLEEAGAFVRRSARWVELHLGKYRRSGAPAIIVLPTNGASGRAAGKLVDRDEWERWLRTLAVSAAPRERRPPPPPLTTGRPVQVIPVGLMSPSQRDRVEKGHRR